MKLMQQNWTLSIWTFLDYYNLLGPLLLLLLPIAYLRAYAHDNSQAYVMGIGNCRWAHIINATSDSKTEIAIFLTVYDIITK